MEAEWFLAEQHGFRNRQQRRRRRERANRAGGAALRTSAHEYPKEQRNDVDIDSDSTSSNSFKDENTALQSAYDSTSVKPTEKHMDKNISNEAEIRWSSPSIIAKLMGLDEQPAVRMIHKHTKKINGYFLETSTVGLRRDKYQIKEARPTWMSTAEHQRFKDVYEVTSIPKVERDTTKLRGKKLMSLEQYKHDSTKQHKADLRFASQKFIDVKHFSRNASFRFSKEPNNKLVDQDCQRKGYPKTFQEPNFSFGKYFHDLKWFAPSHLTSKIAIFKSSKAAKAESSEECCSSERKIDRSNDLRNAVISNFKKPARNATLRHSREEQSGSLIHSLEKLQSAGDDSHLQPKHIVVLKPSVEKACRKGRHILYRNPENVQSANRRLISQSRFQDWPVFSHGLEGIDHNNRGSRETARWNTEQLRESISSNDNFLPDDSSCILPGMNCLCNSEAFWSSPNHFNNRNDIRGLSSSSNVFSREPGNKLSGKWRMTERYSKGVGDHNANGSSALAEMFYTSDLEAQDMPLVSGMVHTVSDEKSTQNSFRSSWGSPSSISSRESWEGGFFTNLPKTMAFASSPSTYRSRSFSGIGQYGDENFYADNNSLRFRPKKFDQRGKFSPVSTNSGNHELRTKNFGKETPEVNSKLLFLPRATDVHRLVITNKVLKQLPMADLPSENSKVSRGDVEEAPVCTQVDSKQLASVSISIKEDNSGCAESLICDHIELHTKTPSSESVVGAKVSEPLEEDGEEDYQTLDPEVDFMDEEERDYTYLLDILIVSGVHGAQQDRLLNACYSPEYPVKPSLFQRLEKKYAKVDAWSRSDRRLMFDLTNSILAEILAPCMSMHSWVDKTKRVRPMWGSEGLLEKTWQMLEERRVGRNVGNAVDEVVQLKWLDLRGKIDEIGLEIERMLREELLDELAVELLILSFQ